MGITVPWNHDTGCPEIMAPFLIGEQMKCLVFVRDYVEIEHANVTCGFYPGLTVPLPQNENENEDYKRAFIAFQGEHATQVALGMSDAAMEGEWRDFNDNEVHYTNWASGEPNSGIGGEHYAVMKLDNGFHTHGLWNDVESSEKAAIFCQHDALSGFGSADCQEKNGTGDSVYDGDFASTVTGWSCAYWTDHDNGQYPQYHGHNYCRKPSVEAWGAWCYTTNPVIDEGWEYCPLAFCKHDAVEILEKVLLIIIISSVVVILCCCACVGYCCWSMNKKNNSQVQNQNVMVQQQQVYPQ